MRQETFVLRVLIDESLERTSDHGVLAHQNHCFASEGLADFVHLLRGDIVNADLRFLSVRRNSRISKSTDDEDGLVLVEQALQLVEVHSLGSSLAPHDFLRMKLGCLRAKSNAIVRLKWSLCDETVIPINLRSKIHGVCEVQLLALWRCSPYLSIAVYGANLNRIVSHY